MISRADILKLEALRQEAPPSEAKGLYDPLITLLTKKRSNKLSPVVKTALKMKPDRILDIGCGYGALAIFFAMHGMSVTGIDLKPDGLEACARLAETLGIQGVSMTQMDACAISPSGFDMAISTDFYEHLPYASQPEHLRSVWKALKPGGTYIVRAPHRANLRQQNREEHIGLPSFTALQRQASDAGFSVRFGIAHTALVSPVNYHIPLEQWFESRKWSDLSIYKGLQKCGLANVLAYLEK
ncbi:MAG: class I SAM-dependent methyltransferase [Desulfovibrio sp.]|jgi:cyclopropane fatty-acyl-phospholipid synthase-like methyltransferase|nr:class I SAM-dependent methyltransferase [Desulfovibrio sp.]